MPLQPHHRVITLLLLLLPCGSRADDTTSGSYHGEFVYNGFAGANLTLDGAATYEDLSASGLAFVIAADSSVLSTAMPGEFLGLLNGSDDGNRSTHVFAVEFDTLFDADLGDMNSNHVGVDVDSLVSIAAESAGYYDDATGVFRNLTLISRKAMQVWVDYDAGATLVTVTMAPLGLPRPKKPLLQTTVDLSDVIVKQGATASVYVGFSSATGMLFSRHFVLGWSLSLHGGPAPELNILELPALPPAGPTKARSSKQVTEMIVIPIASATLILVVGVAIYAMARRRSKYAELREEWEMPFGAHRFSYRDLFLVSSATGADDDGQQFVYQGFASANLSLDGLAVVTPDGLLALTNATDQAKGHAFHPGHLHFVTNKKARSFSSCFVFAILSPYDGLSDYGLAFVVAPATTNFSTAKAGQYLGLLNATNGTARDPVLAVELNTIINPEFRDINGNHVGIDLNSLVSAKAEPAGYYDDDDTAAGGGGAFKNLTLNSHEPMLVWVEYDGEATQLNVTLAPVNVRQKPRRPLVSMDVELSNFFVEDDPMYVGFSSGTGVIPTRHCVLGCSFSMDGPAPPLDLSKLPVLPRYAELREDWEDEFGPHRFSYKDLFHATDGFKDRNLLGVGGFGRVYKGVLHLHQASSSSSNNLLAAAQQQVVALKRVSLARGKGVCRRGGEHRSPSPPQPYAVTRLLQACRRKDELLLVYDYMENGSLDKYLHDGRMPTLPWHDRYRVIKGVAASLLYLHEDWEQVVIHRDVKPSNVLLDGEMNARLGDFGLARLYDRGIDPQTTHVVGTIGYVAPELIRTGKATPFSDVFALGVFVLEVVCARRPIGPQLVSIVDWVIEHHHNGTIIQVVDPRLLVAGEYQTEEL
nr:unnamed protein product [Digitaria exilis]